MMERVVLFISGFAAASVPAYYQLRGDLRNTQRLIDRSVDQLRETVIGETKELQTRINGKGCYFLVFVPTIREIRDFYREMRRTNRESVIL
eukprot:SAG31_NODE_518_length_14674_cov_39.604803_8_plen_91_part_00